MFDQLDSFIIRYDELSELLSDPEVIGDTKRFMELTKEEANLRPKVETFKRYQQVVEEISDTEEMLGESLDAEMAEKFNLQLRQRFLYGRIKLRFAMTLLVKRML